MEIEINVKGNRDEDVEYVPLALDRKVFELLFILRTGIGCFSIFVYI